jgi:hypothetical protein
MRLRRTIKQGDTSDYGFLDLCFSFVLSPSGAFALLFAPLEQSEAAECIALGCEPVFLFMGAAKIRVCLVCVHRGELGFRLFVP